MKRMQHVFPVICAGVGALYLQVNAAHADDATITIVRPGACAAQANSLSTEMIRLEPATASAPEAAGRRTVSVIRPYPLAYETKGWAAERLLRRFDLQVAQRGIQIINTSPFCVEER